MIGSLVGYFKWLNGFMESIPFWVYFVFFVVLFGLFWVDLLGALKQIQLTIIHHLENIEKASEEIRDELKNKK